MNTKNPINISPSPNQRKIQRVNRFHNPLAKGMTSTIGGAVSNFGFDTLGAIVGGEINDYYNRKAEQRADARYRDLLRDTPRLTVEARRAAGLNPYGDAVLPGQVTQSTPDTSPVSSGAFSRSRGDTLEEQLALAKIENETLVSQATADKLEAEADRLRGQEGRDVERFPVEVENLRQKTANLIQERNNLIASENVDKKQLEVMDASIAKAFAEESLAFAEAELAKKRVDALDEDMKLTRAQTFEVYESMKLAWSRLDHDKNVDLNLQRLKAAEIAVADRGVDVEQFKADLNAELGREGKQIDWSSLSSSTLNWILWGLLFLVTKKPASAKVIKGFASKVAKNL